MNCPSCGHADSIPVNLENTLLECSRCHFRFHISGIDHVEIGYILDPASPHTPELTNILERARLQAELDNPKGK